jgi:hypothetical protein
MNLKRHPYETEIEEALEKAVAISGEKSKTKKTFGDEKAGSRSASLTQSQLQRMDRFDEFIRKWEPQLECMKQMVTELHEAEFLDSLTNLVDRALGGAHDVSEEDMNTANLEGGSPSEEKFVFERKVSESEEEDSKLEDSVEDGQGKKQSTTMSIVDGDEVTVLPSRNASDDVPKKIDKQQMCSKGGEQVSSVVGEVGKKVTFCCFTYIFLRVMLNAAIVLVC